MRGPGYSFQVPKGWRVSVPRDMVAARKGTQLITVSLFPLLKPYDPAKFEATAKELDRVVDKLAGGSVDSSETIDVAGRKVRSYRYGTRRIGFVLDGRREWQLYCEHPGEACDLLFSSFTLR